MTRREAQLLEAFEQHVERTGRVHSRTGLRSAMGWQSLGTVQYFLNRLASKGAIELVHGDSPDRRPRRSPSATGDIPILGRIAADSELLADENMNIEDTRLCIHRLRPVPHPNGLPAPRLGRFHGRIGDPRGR
ncbi:MAG: hypothetical protein OXC11_09665, partial [Rhodospirillales bacterium]|nr:hypothetical protein [Rhodospirillales bacterium]